MNRGLADPVQTTSNRILAGATILGGMALVLYYAAPYTPPRLGFSPHVLAVTAGFLLLFLLRPLGISRSEVIVALVFLGMALLSVLSAPTAPNTDMLRVWLISIAAFWLFRITYLWLPQNGLDIGVQLFLALWSLAAIAQALFAGPAYVSSWFGRPPNVVYATGLSNFSDHGAILILPLLLWTLVFNLNQPDWRRGLLWFTGCAALYFTLSRAGWLALLIAMMVLVMRLRGKPGHTRRLFLHAALALLAALLAWAVPAPQINLYEPGGVSSAGRWQILNSETAGKFSRATRLETSQVDSAVDFSRATRPETSQVDSVGDFSRATRLVTLQVALKAVAEYPLTGVGLGRFPDYYAKHRANYLTDALANTRVYMTPHNGYTQFLSEVGIPAFLALLVWLWLLLRQASMNTEPAALALHASILGMMVWLLFHDGLYDRLFWILLGSAAALGTKQSSLRRGV